MNVRLRGIISMCLVLLAGLSLAGLWMAGLKGHNALASGRAASTLYVDSSGTCGGKSPCYTHPQLAVDAAAPGDVIKVNAAGIYTRTYNRNGHEQIIHISKTLTLIGGYNPSFTEPVSPSMKVSLSPPPFVRGVYIDDAANVTLRYFFIYGASGSVGSAIYVRNADLTLQNSVFVNNSGSNCAALSLQDGRLVIEETTFTNNYAAGSSAALCAINASSGSRIYKSSFTNNTANYDGAIYLVDSVVQIERSWFSNNIATGGSSGALGLSYGNYNFTNNIFVQNDAFYGPTVMSFDAATATLQHNTFNGEPTTKELIELMSNSSLAMYNNLLVNAAIGVDVNDSHLEGNHNIFHAITNTAQMTGTSDIALTNVFTNGPGFEDTTSYAIDADSFAEGKALDIGIGIDYSGAFRPLGSGPDIGAIEAPEPFSAISTTNTTSTFQDPNGLTTTFVISAASSINNLTFKYTPLVEPGYSFTYTLGYAGRAFKLTADPLQWKRLIFLPLVLKDALQRVITARLSQPLPSLQSAQTASILFDKPVLIMLNYLDQDLHGLDERNLRLYYFDESHYTWLDAATTCATPMPYIRDISTNWLGVYICHLSRFGVGGK